MLEISIRNRECRTPVCPTIGLSSIPPLAGVPPFASRPFPAPGKKQRSRLHNVPRYDAAVDEIPDLFGRPASPGVILQVAPVGLVGQHSPPVVLHELAQ